MTLRTKFDEISSLRQLSWKYIAPKALRDPDADTLYPMCKRKAPITAGVYVRRLADSGKLYIESK